MNYEHLINEIAKDAFETYKAGGSSLFQIGRIPGIEYMDYNSLMEDLNEIFRDLVEDYGIDTWEYIEDYEENG